MITCFTRPGMCFSINYLIWLLRVHLRAFQNVDANLIDNHENRQVKHRARSYLKLKHTLLKSYSTQVSPPAFLWSMNENQRVFLPSQLVNSSSPTAHEISLKYERICIFLQSNRQTDTCSLWQTNFEMSSLSMFSMVCCHFSCLQKRRSLISE